jgi:hypothetical protein
VVNSRSVAFGVGLSIASLTLAAPAQAYPLDVLPGQAVCSFRLGNGLVTPGLASNPVATAGFSSGPAPVTCQGFVDGSRITGPGEIRERGPLTGTCLGGTGVGVQILAIPTERGTLRFENPIWLEWVGPLGTLASPHLTGSFQFLATSGDCVTTPLSGYARDGQGVLRG